MMKFGLGPTIGPADAGPDAVCHHKVFLSFY
jgi:hypothetical protein